MTHLVWEHILDPILTYAELVRISEENGIDFSQKELSAVLRLLVIGGYTETKLYSTWGGSLSHVSGKGLEKTIKDWSKGFEEAANE